MDSALVLGARKLFENFHVKIGKNEGYAVVSAATSQRRIQAAAEANVSTQEKDIVKIVEHIHRMVGNKQWKGIFFIEHQDYDETPLDVRVASSHELPAEREVAKVYMVQSTWTMIIQQLTSPFSEHSKPDNPPNYSVLEGHFSAAVRAGAAGNAETIAAVLKTCPCPPATLIDQCFPHSLRLVETDEGKANPRCEGFLREGRSQQWSVLYSLCLAHKIHTGAMKAWLLQEPVLSAITHLGKFLRTSGAMTSLKHAIATLIDKKFVVYAVAPLTQAAEDFKRKCDIFLPGLGRPKRRAWALEALKFFNGNWQTHTRCSWSIPWKHLLWLSANKTPLLPEVSGCFSC